MFSVFIPRAQIKSHVPTRPASPDMFDSDNTVGKIRPKEGGLQPPTRNLTRTETEVVEPPLTTDIQVPPGTASDCEEIGPSTDTEAVSTRFRFFKGTSKKGKGPSKKGKGPAKKGKQTDYFPPTSHEAGGSGLRYTLLYYIKIGTIDFNIIIIHVNDFLCHIFNIT